MINVKNLVCFFVLWAFCCLLIQCTSEGKNEQQFQDPAPSTVNKAKDLIHSAIVKQGGAVIDNSIIEFKFRNRFYRAKRSEGTFQYERIFEDSLAQEVRDVRSNVGFQRFVDGALVDITEERAKAYTNSVNSVIYFALLPYFLTDPAAKLQYLGEEVIKQKDYHKIIVTFSEVNGGKDFQDEFVYWFEKETFSMDYLAYNYIVDGGGARFRSAYNHRVIDGVHFADYVNYRPHDESRDIAQFGVLFEQGALKELSKIELEEVAVTPIHK